MQLVFPGIPSTSSSRGCHPPASSYEGWVGHPLDPVGCLFDTLTKASLINPENTPAVAAEIFRPEESGSDSRSPQYHHVLIPGSQDRNESYLTLALEVALIGTYTPSACLKHSPRVINSIV